MALPQINCLVNGFGADYASGTATGYYAGTTTLVSWFEDAAATIPAANPYILSSTGNAVLYCSDRLKLDVKNSDGVSAPGFPIDNLGFGVYAPDNWILATNYGTAKTDATLQAAITALGTVNPYTLYVEPATWVISNNLTFPDNISVKFDNGTIFSVANGKTVTFNGTFTADPVECFTGLGTVDFGLNSTAIRPSIWGSPVFTGESVLYKTTGDTAAGMINWTHDGDTAYLMHLKTGANFTGTANGSGEATGAACLGIGVGDGGKDYGTGLLVSNKKSGIGIAVSNEGTTSTAQAYGFYGSQSSTLAPMAKFVQQVTGAAPALQLGASATAGTGQVLFETISTSGGPSLFGYRTMRHYADTGTWQYYSNVHLDGALLTVSDLDNATTDVSQVRIKATSDAEPYLGFFRVTGGAGTWYPHKIATSANELTIRSGAAAAIGAETYDAVALRVSRAGASASAIGFYGAAPAAQPNITGAKGGNAALANLITALANLGLVTDSTT